MSLVLQSSSYLEVSLARFRHFWARTKGMDEGLCEKEMTYSRLTALFSDNRLSDDVCKKACSLFNVRCIEDLSYLED